MAINLAPNRGVVGDAVINVLVGILKRPTLVTTVTKIWAF